MRICLIGGKSPAEKNPGGAERQIHLLSKYFAESGNTVYHIIGNYTGPELSSSGVHYPSTWKYGGSFPLIRFFTENLASLKKTLSSINPEMIYTRGFSEFAPFVGHFAARNKHISVAGLAHDRDIDFELADSLRSYSSLFSSIRFRIAFQRFQKYLRSCSLVIAQTENQKEMLLRRRIKSAVIGNIVEPAPEHLLNDEENTDIIWVASIFKKKGPERLLDIVKMMPEITFTIVGRLGDKKLKPILNAIAAQNNVKYLGHLEHHETQMEIAKHRIVINTSIAEGFSNVFLEAWALGKPIVSLNVNPDNLLSGQERLGYCMDGDTASLVETTIKLLKDKESRQRIGNRGRTYIAKNHSPKNVLRLIKLFNSRINHL